MKLANRVSKEITFFAYVSEKPVRDNLFSYRLSVFPGSKIDQSFKEDQSIFSMLIHESRRQEMIDDLLERGYVKEEEETKEKEDSKHSS